MSKIVFILGAGASKHCGTPLMNNFLDEARNLLRKGEVDEVGNSFNNVFDAIGKLHAVHSKAIIDTENIESVYTAFEMGSLLGKLPGIHDDERIDSLIPAIRKVIGYTLERTTKIPNRGTPDAPSSYYEFADIINTLIEREEGCSIITFNYDLGLDYSLYRRGIVSDYGIDDIDLTTNRHITFLKLHGSINFGLCSNLSCCKIAPYRQFQYTETVAGRDYSTIPIISRLNREKCKQCGHPLQLDPLIIPPTWNKTTYHDQIGEVWRRAADELKEVEHIFVLGYSLPATDWFFNYLYGLSVEMETPVQGFHVYNPDMNVKGRFQALLGPGVSNKLEFYEVGFEEAVSRVNAPHFQNIREILGINNITRRPPITKRSRR